LEYFREENNKIQAGLALNVGKLICQYSEKSNGFPVDQKYDATLVICCLQTLLTNCSELFKAMKSDCKTELEKQVNDIPSFFGLKKSFVVQDTFTNGKTTYAQFIEHLRNALSHPTCADKGNMLSTGYTTVLDNTQVINKLVFTDSPWVIRGEMHSKYSELKNKFNSEKSSLNRILDGLIEKYNNAENLAIKFDPSDKKYKVFQHEKVYYPVFVAEIPLTDLYLIAIQISNYLAQPTQDNWDGRSISKLLAA
jgi:hypothetical protein